MALENGLQRNCRADLGKQGQGGDKVNNVYTALVGLEVLSVCENIASPLHPGTDENTEAQKGDMTAKPTRPGSGAACPPLSPCTQPSPWTTSLLLQGKVKVLSIPRDGSYYLALTEEQVGLAWGMPSPPLWCIHSVLLGRPLWPGPRQWDKRRNEIP